MQTVKLTKTALKRQRDDLRRYQRYLPTLRIKQRQLQHEIVRVDTNARGIQAQADQVQNRVDGWIELCAEEVGLDRLLQFERVEIRWNNVAGVDVPEFIEAHLHTPRYDLMSTPPWIDHALAALRTLIRLSAQAEVLKEQKRRLQRELRATAQRVNLLERVKIPERLGNIRRITVHLGDQQTAAFGWALLAKRKAATTQQEPP